MDTELLAKTGFRLPEDVREQINIAYGHLFRAHITLVGARRQTSDIDMFRDFAISRIACSLKELGWLGFGGEDDLE
jgi:hypothetical protein